MKKNKPDHKAWNLIRIALLWARKRRVFRRRNITELRLFPKFLKSLPFKNTNHPKTITYREQQFSFDATPIRSFKKLSPSAMRFKIPCIGRAKVDYDYDVEYGFINGINDYEEARKSFLKDYQENEVYNDGTDDDEDNFLECEVFEETVNDDEENEVEIDVKADSFIAQFYEEMKLQRQLSYVRRNEMFNRSII